MNKRWGVWKIILACVFWSFGGLLSKFVPWNALTITGARALVAIVVLAVARRSVKPVLTRGAWLGAFGVIGTSTLFMFANKLTSAANAIVLQYAMPLFVIVYTAIVLRRRPTRLDVWAVTAVTAGVILCFCQGFQTGGMLGNTLALISAGTYTIMYLASGRKDTTVLDYTYLGNLIAVCMLINMPFDAGVTANPVHWLAALAMGLCLSFGYLAFGAGVRDGVSPTVAAIVSNVEPILNPTWCFVFLGENPGPLSIAGALVVLVAVTLYTILPNLHHARATA